MTNFRYVLMLMVLCTLTSGCVRRRMTIRSSPPGALVFVDGQEIGRTPVATPFIYYGTRNLRLVKDGYETISVNQPFRAPWYQVPPLDFVSENMVPHELRDERVVDFEMVPLANVSMDDVLIHADQLRAEVVPAAAQSFNASPSFDSGILQNGGPVATNANVGPPVVSPADAAGDYGTGEYGTDGTLESGTSEYGNQGGPASMIPDFGGFHLGPNGRAGL